MASVFISYSEKDVQTAKRIANELSRRGVNVWFDLRKILAGDSVAERINEGIRTSDFLIVLLSKNSDRSVWVGREIASAFKRFGDAASSAIIPVKIDDSPVPPAFREIRYADVSRHFEEGLGEVIARIHRDSAATAKPTELLSVDDLAKDLAAERTAPRGPEFYVTAVLGILTVVATLVAAWPTFQTAFAQIPKVYYDLREDLISLPPGSDDAKALQTLQSVGIAPGTLRIRIINKGQAVAKDVKVGVKTTGSLLYAKTEPSSESKTVWVSVDLQSFHAGDGEVVVELKDLVPGRAVLMTLGFQPRNNTLTTDVVADGGLAEKVSDIQLLPNWTLFEALALPIRILMFGIVTSLLVGVIIAASHNPRFLAKLLDLLTAISPPIASIVRGIMNLTAKANR